MNTAQGSRCERKQWVRQEIVYLWRLLERLNTGLKITVYSFYSKVKQPEHIQRAGVPKVSPLVAVEGLKKKSLIEVLRYLISAEVPPFAQGPCGLLLPATNIEINNDPARFKEAKSGRTKRLLYKTTVVLLTFNCRRKKKGFESFWIHLHQLVLKLHEDPPPTACSPYPALLLRSAHSDSILGAPGAREGLALTNWVKSPSLRCQAVIDCAAGYYCCS